MSLDTYEKRSVEKLKTLVTSGCKKLGFDASAEAVIEWAAENFTVSACAVACSMADGVLPGLVAEKFSGVDVLFLETGYHFAQTEETKKQIQQSLRVNVRELAPRQTVVEQDASYGEKLFLKNPSLCCAMRKMEPLKDALNEYEVWFTGVRRDESITRADTPLVTWDSQHGLVKINPVATWSLDEILGYAEEHLLPVNPLVSEGYLSIGCAPCTRPVAPGEDPRAGRWSGTSKTECGIHL